MTNHEAPTGAPETASRRVLMSPELMAAWASRNTRGDLVTWDWGEPDVDGFYTPTLTEHYDDNIADKARAAVLAELRAAVEGLVAADRSRYHVESYVGLTRGGAFADALALIDGLAKPEAGR